MFTATAVMQLHEQGRVTLDTDVNEYLTAFQVGRPSDRPITLAHLLTHTSGLADTLLGIMDGAESPPQDLTRYLAQNVPPPLRPPEEMISYNNHGFMVAGGVVEAITGQAFREYVRENVFRPLDMPRSTFWQSPETLAEMATGYGYTGRYVEVPFYHVKTGPAGSLVTTGTDMAAFMLAHLNHGCYQDRCILEASTLELMHRPHAATHPAMPGVTYGFYEYHTHGRRALIHTGGTPGFSGMVFLLPEQRLGFFLATNRFGGDIYRRLVERFMDRYYPSEATQLRPPAEPLGQEAERFRGVYRSTDYPPYRWDKLTVLLGMTQEVKVSVADDGRALIVNGESYEQVEPLLFRAVDGTARIAFREDDRGEITQLALSGLDSISGHEKLAWYDRLGFQLALVGMSVFTSLVGILFWPFASVSRFIRRLVRGRDVRPHLSAWAQLALWMTVVIGLLNIAGLVGLVQGLMIRDDRDLVALVTRTPPVFTRSLVLLHLAALCTAGLVILMGKVRADETVSPSHRLHLALILVGQVALVGFMVYWNLWGVFS